MIELTDKQRECLIFIADQPLGTGEIARRTSVSIDAAHSRMRGLEDKLLVRRVQQGIQGSITWELTRLGRANLL